MNQDRKKELLKKFAERSLSPSEEQEFWEMAASGEHMLLQDDDADLDISRNISTPDDIEDSIASVKNNLTAKIRADKKKPLKPVLRIAAGIAAVLLIFAGIKGYQYNKYIQDTKTFITVQASVGKTLRIVLPDSTSVTVSSGSVLRYPKAFPTDERRVYLQTGEAFFEVTKNPKKPFSVESGEVQTTALGTSFTVKYNPVHHWGKVNLYTGKVAITPTDKSSSRSSVYLIPGKAYEYAAGKEALSSFVVKPFNPLTTGLAFERTSFKEAVYKISSWYKINIEFDKVNTRNFTVNGDFNGKKAEEVLSSLAFIYQLKLTKKDSLTYEFITQSRY